ncbi:hypothetical protein [Shimia sp. MMG029]|uniref:hypothetical protein n=1 Tax=Shimia sp. MMG029 TaxID=3021978 RepID=UPI0022FE3600|nr:hypothetical protein [Shimia sp. MMG029]MDA5558000.1 hypothetical protein [Shimia sp. MMG029]
MSQDVLGKSSAQSGEFGRAIVAPGEPFTDTTLLTIRALLAESDPVPQPKPLSFSLPAKSAGRTDPLVPPQRNPYAVAPEPVVHGPEGHGARQVEVAPGGGQSSAACAAEESPLPPRRSWRRIEVVESWPGRNLRRVLMSPRMLAVGFLCGVVIWEPWFIPALALMMVSAVLLIGALIGQDRMARIVLYLLKRFVWADPSLGRLLQRILPARWHGILYRPVTEADAWDGLIDPSFEARLARIRR